MPLLIPIPPIQELSPEELEPLKDTLLAHLRSQNATTHEIVDKNLHVTRGERVPAYLFTLHSLLETRDAVPTTVVKPYSPEAAKNISPVSGPSPDEPSSAPDIWTFPSEERPDFTPHTDTYFLPSSLQVEDCRECYQKGELGCKACMGKGVESCPTCLGAGRQSCVFCKGSEKVNCLRCGGEGRLASGEVGGRSASCDACAGSGKFPCTHCKEGKVSCPQCRGGAKVPCQKCKGKGKLTCAACGGQKKILSGKAFQATFKPFQVRSSALAEVCPKPVLEMALEKTSEVGALTLLAGESLDDQVKGAVVPEPVRNALTELVERENAHLSSGTRAVKRRLDLAEGAVVRISGYCAGQEFSFWMSPETHRIVAEKDPMAAFGSTAASSAEEAREAGDWKKALALARESISYSPTNAAARGILGAWRRKVMGETIFAGVLAGAIAALGQMLWIGFFDKGLHKAGVMVHAGGGSMVLGPLAALALLPVLFQISQFLFRGILLAVGLGVVLILSAVVPRWSAESHPVRKADQAALNAELKEHFKYGMTQVYFDQDLRFLQALANKYKETQVDLKEVNESLAFQLELRAKLGRHQEEFERKVSEILDSNESVARKRMQLTKLASRYRLMGVDLNPSEAALQRLRSDETQKGTKRPVRVSHIRITSEKPVKPTKGTTPRGAKPKARAKGGSPQKTSSPPRPRLTINPDEKKTVPKSETKPRWWE
ncbi:MAG: hypothetical protein IPN90_13165 [Elusimicrobia bacterium]|nr:hypothetical protein [Elusimicrobiota bacterium]